MPHCFRHLRTLSSLLNEPPARGRDRRALGIAGLAVAFAVVIGACSWKGDTDGARDTARGKASRPTVFNGTTDEFPVVVKNSIAILSNGCTGSLLAASSQPPTVSGCWTP